MNNAQTLRERQIAFFQENLRKLRSVVGWSGSDLAEVIGVTRQTINNLENNKTQMTSVQYLALCAVVERVKRLSPELRKIIAAVLDRFPGKAEIGDSMVDVNLFDQWFNLSSEMFAAINPDTDAIGSLDLMEKFARDCKIFLSPELLFSKNTRECIDNLSTTLQKYGNKMIVPSTELQCLIAQYKDSSHDVVVWINGMQKEKIIRLLGDDDDPPFNELIISLFIRHRACYELCLITQNVHMAQDILSLNSWQTLPGHPIHVACISSAGVLAELRRNQNQQDVVMPETPISTLTCKTEESSKGNNGKETSLIPKFIQDWETL
jgi:DNA-binding XRE family transcriptional regulator